MQLSATINSFVRDINQEIVNDLQLVAASNFTLDFTIFNEDNTPHNLTNYSSINCVVKNGTIFNSFANQSTLSANNVTFDLYPSVLTYQIASTSANYIVLDALLDQQFIKNDKIVITDSSLSGTYYISSITKDSPNLSQTKLTLTTNIGTSTSGNLTHYEIHGNPSTIDYNLFVYGIDTSGNITQLVQKLPTSITPAVNPSLSVQTPFLIVNGVLEAPLDGNLYARRNGAWEDTQGICDGILTSANTYTDQQIDILDSSLTSLIASTSANTLNDANDYTDAQIALLPTPIDYTPLIASTSAITLTSANDYTDQAIATIDLSDAVTSANAYSDQQNITLSGNIISYINLQDQAVLTSANTYTNNALSGYNPSGYAKLAEVNTFTKDNIFNGTVFIAQPTSNGVAIGKNNGVQIGNYALDISSLKDTSGQVPGHYCVQVGLQNSIGNSAHGTIASVGFGKSNATIRYGCSVAGISNYLGGVYGSVFGRDNTINDLCDGGIIFGSNNTISNHESFAVGRLNTIGRDCWAYGRTNTMTGQAGVYTYAFGGGNTVPVAGAGSVTVGKSLNNAIAQSVQIGTDNANKMILLQTGELGIGGGTPLDFLSINKSPVASTTKALVNLSNTVLVGGNANGTYIGANPASFSGDFVNLQVGGVNKFKVDNGGLATIGPAAQYAQFGNISYNPALKFYKYATQNMMIGGWPNVGVMGFTSNGVSPDLLIDGVAHRVGVAVFNNNNVPLDTLSIGTPPVASATNALINLTNTVLVAGNSNGTYIGANPVSTSADFANLQVGGATKLRIDKDGLIQSNGNTITNTDGLAIAAGTGISVTQTIMGTTITNTAIPTINLVAVPATSSSSGTVGDVAVDASTGYIYNCIAINTWVRTQGATW